MLHWKWYIDIDLIYNNGRYIVINNYMTLSICYEMNEFSYIVLYCIILHELKFYIEHDFVFCCGNAWIVRLICVFIYYVFIY